MKHILKYSLYKLNEGTKYHGKTISEYLTDFQEKYQDRTLVFFDTETTGFHRRADQLTEVAGIATDINFNEIGSFRRKIKLHPGILNRRPRAKQVLSWTRYGERGMKYEEEQEVLQAFVEWIDSFENPVMVAQNANFDMRFIARYEKGKINNLEAIDTKDILEMFFLPALTVAANQGDMEAETILSNIPMSGSKSAVKSSSMGKVTPALGINADEWHRADADVKMMIQMLKTVNDWLRDHQNLEVKPEQERFISRKRYFNKKRRMNRGKSKYTD